MRTRKILLVDDEVTILRTLGRALRAEGNEVATAESGAEALAALRDGDFDLVVTDLVMEDLGGIDVLREAKERDPDVCVVVLSGYCDVTSAVEALRLGAEDYLAKPFDYDEILLRIRRCLEKREMRRKIRLYEDILPLCSVCKRVRDDAGREPGSGEWVPLEEYLSRKAGVRTSHGCCPACREEWGKGG